MILKGHLTPRLDNGLVNSSPVSATTPIVRLQHGCTRTIKIPGNYIVVAVEHRLLMNNQCFMYMYF